jgi:hypothetical protein
MVDMNGGTTDYIFTPEKKNGRFGGMRLMEIHGDDRESCYYDPQVHTAEKSHYCSHLWRARKCGNTYELIRPFGSDRGTYMKLIPI